VADELRRQADVFLDIVELQPKIGRDPAERAAREAREPYERHTPQFLQRSTAPQRAPAPLSMTTTISSIERAALPDASGNPVATARFVRASMHSGRIWFNAPWRPP
jgi:hypothetical protein